MVIGKIFLHMQTHGRKQNTIGRCHTLFGTIVGLAASEGDVGKSRAVEHYRTIGVDGSHLWVRTGPCAAEKRAVGWQNVGMQAKLLQLTREAYGIAVGHSFDAHRLGIYDNWFALHLITEEGIGREQIRQTQGRGPVALVVRRQQHAREHQFHECCALCLSWRRTGSIEGEHQLARGRVERALL